MRAWRKLLGLEAQAPQERPAPDDDFWYNSAPTATDAMAIAANYACVRAIAKSIASMPVSLMRRRPDGGAEVAEDHPLHQVVHMRPHSRFTASEFWDFAVTQMLVRGNFLGRLRLDSRDNVAEIEPVRWATVDAKVINGRHVFTYSTDSGERKAMIDSEVLFIPGDMYDGVRGYSPVETAAAPSRISATAQRYVLNYFDRGGLPPAYVSFPTILSTESRDRWSKWFRAKFQGASNAGAIAVLDGGGKIDVLNLNHEAMQLIELRQQAAEEACSIWGVPQHIAGILTRSTYNNIEHQALEFVKYTLRPWCKRVEDRLNTSLLGVRESRGLFFKFNMEAMLRGDSTARAALYSALAQIGGITPNEIRAKEDMNPVDGGDVALVQGALVPLPLAGKHLEAK